MRNVPKLAVALLLVTYRASGGEIYGTISERGRPVVREGVAISCRDTNANPSADEKQTDGFGSYRLFVKSLGPCDLTVRDLAPVQVLSYGNAQRYNFEIVGVDGKTILQRR